MAGKRKDKNGRVLKTGENQRKNGTYDYRYTDPHGKVRCVYAKTLESLREDVYKRQTISKQKTKINNLEKEVDELEDRNFDLFCDLYFYEEYAAIVPDDGRKRYHIYGCEDCDTSSFWIYNIEAAEQYGYYPCPKCY